MAILFLLNAKKACCCAKTMSIYSFWFDVHREYISRARHIKYYLERDNKHTYNFCTELFYFSIYRTNTYNFEAVSDKLNTCSSH